MKKYPLPEEVNRRYSKILLEDQITLKRKLRNLESEFVQSPKDTDKDLVLAKAIMETLMELREIENEIEDLIVLAFFPYHDVPILKLLTDERYNESTIPRPKGPIPGTGNT